MCAPCREYQRVNRKRWPRNRTKPRKTGKTPAIVCGRKFCSVCKRWRHLLDFGVARWVDPITREVPMYWRSQCLTCERVIGREKNARLNGRDRPYGARQPRMRGQTRNRHWYQKHLERMKDPEYAARYREYQRMWAEGKRREMGVPAREAMYEKRQILDGTPMVDATAFKDWFNSLNGSTPSSESLGEALTRRISAVRSGEQKKIHLSLVDEVGHIVGATHLTHTLYPND